ncbi:hypothetical protein [Nocardia brasiliensis]|uniref:hypothetical protein n=1 Tax=Nocardia brasiliensis TaxID=37326 RepID=UPI003D8B2D31
MPTDTANGDLSRLSFWSRVREFAVPPGMIETATVRRLRGDWAGACAAAGFDIDLDLRSTARTHGRELAARIRSDLRYLAPDLLRWHLPRIAPDGLLRPGLTSTLARYPHAGHERGSPPGLELVVRTAPAWADAGQRISLALSDGSAKTAAAQPHPHPRPDRRYRLDLHRHLWDARRTDELRARCGAGEPPAGPDPELLALLPPSGGCAAETWAVEARLLLDAEKCCGSAFVVRLGGRRRLVLRVDGGGPPTVRLAPGYPAGGVTALPVLPDAATWTLPDLALLSAGAITSDRLHPLVAAALVPGGSAVAQQPYAVAGPRLVTCRGEQHRIGFVDGVLSALDHDPVELRREELLAALSGTPLPCLQAIDVAHRAPDCLAGIRERLHHGDIAGALALVEGLLGPGALLRDGALRDELEAAARRRITYGLFRSGLSEAVSARVPTGRDRRRDRRAHPRNATLH